MADERFSPLMMRKIRSLTRVVNVKELAVVTEIDYTKLSRFLNDDLSAERAYLYPQELWRLAVALRVTVEYLCDDSQPDIHGQEKFPAHHVRRRTKSSGATQDEPVDNDKLRRGK